MKRSFVIGGIVAAAVVAGGGAATGVALAGGDAPVAATVLRPPRRRAPAIGTAALKPGTALVDGAGRTLYLFEADNGTSSTCYGQCAQIWAPVPAGGPTSRRGAGRAGGRDHAHRRQQPGHLQRPPPLLLRERQGRGRRPRAGHQPLRRRLVRRRPGRRQDRLRRPGPRPGPATPAAGTLAATGGYVTRHGSRFLTGRAGHARAASVRVRRAPAPRRAAAAAIGERPHRMRGPARAPAGAAGSPTGRAEQPLDAGPRRVRCRRPSWPWRTRAPPLRGRRCRRAADVATATSALAITCGSWWAAASSSASISSSLPTRPGASRSSGTIGNAWATSPAAVSNRWWRAARCACSWASTADSSGPLSRSTIPRVTTTVRCGPPTA